MKICPHCDQALPADSLTCPHCARSLADKPAASSSVTIRWQGKLPREEGLQCSLSLATIFANKSTLLLGRAAECDVFLPHPTVSRRHAVLAKEPAGIWLRDLGSVNGVLVNGQRIQEPVLLQEDQRVGIGPFLFRLADGFLYLLDSSQRLRLEARGLEKVIDGGRRRLLDNINLVLEPGEFLSLLGPSGSGKSTLLDCLSGRRPATGGLVLANGENFYRHFNSFRQSLGYVPQQDIVHTQLTVERALHYTARLRLPPDTNRDELRQRIEDVLQQMELTAHRRTFIGQLSGGQIKRVSLGAELLARPCLLFIDEATSGLDAGTETRMMRLFRQLADEGKSLVCITHNVDNVDLCNLILVLARGKVVYCGPPAEARTYFRVSRLSEVYDCLATRPAEDWEKTFRSCSLYQEFVAQRLQVGAPALGPTTRDSARDRKGESSTSLVFRGPTESQPRTRWHQFRVLATRSLELMWRDPRALRFLFLQAPLVAFLILLGFANAPYDEKILVPRRMTETERGMLVRFGRFTQDMLAREKDNLDQADPDGKFRKMLSLLGDMPNIEGPVIPDQFIVNPRTTFMLVFLLVIIVLWFGCNNAAKEIIKELPIYKRERAVNLGILPYLGSKFLVLSGVTVFQSVTLMGLIYGTLELFHWLFGHAVPPEMYRLAYGPQFAMLVVLSMTSVAMGLLLSAWVTTSDQASVLLPYVLIPQIILGGGIITIKDGALYYLAVVFSPAYWAYRGIHRGVPHLPRDLPWHQDYNDSIWLCGGVLLIQMLLLLGLTGWLLRRKDLPRG